MVTFGSPISGSFTRLSSIEPGSIILSNIQNTEQNLVNLQEILSSGFAFSKPSENPIGAVRVLNYTTAISQNKVFQTNVQSATSQLQMTDTSLSGAGQDVTNGLQVYQTQRGGVSDAQSRQQASTQVELMLEDAVRQANARLAGNALFGGSQTQKDPFTIVNGNVVFNGNLNALNSNVSDGIQFVSNVTGAPFGALSDGIQGQNAVTQQPIDLNPAVTLSTKLADLHGGSGVALGSIRITGAGTATVDLGIAKTVGDVINLINDPKVTAVTGVTASINLAKNGLQLTSGSAITVQEVSQGTSARDLGIQVSGAGSPAVGSDLDPRLTADTAIGSLFAGTGIDPSGLVITNQTSGLAYTATIGGAVLGPTSTVQQFLNAINGSSAFVQAQINAKGTGIDVLSRLSGGRLTISENGGTTAQQLGLLSTLARAKIVDLNNGNGVGTIAGADLQITKKDGTQIQIDVDNAKTMQDLVDTLNASGLTASLTPGGQLQITDPNPANGTLKIQNLNGSSAATDLGIETSASGVGATTITGTPLTFAGVQTEGVFTGLIRLRDALAANSVGGMDSAFRVLTTASNKLLESRADVGARLQSLTLTQNRLQDESTQLQTLVSSTRDADLAATATQFQLQQNVLQAALAAASRVLQTNLISNLNPNL
jgi:flagellar hook-associated protein 3 FlgL